MKSRRMSTNDSGLANQLEEQVTQLNLDNDEEIDEDNIPTANGSRGPGLVTNDILPKDPVYSSFENKSEKLFDVSVANPEKFGEGMSAYVVYHVKFEGYADPFSNMVCTSVHRFSEFMHLYEKLVTKHVLNGVIVPPAPGKDVLATTKVKISKNASLENEFVKRRRLALERFLVRLLNHPVLSMDKYLIDFLQQSRAPRSTGQILSSGTAKRIMRNLGDAFGKISYKMDDPDDVFYAKTEELTCWDRQLRRLHSALSSLGTAEQEFAAAKFAESRAVACLANVEEHTGLAQALGRLAETGEQVSRSLATQADSQVLHLTECACDTLDLIQACKDVLEERVKVHRTWKNTEALLRTKREQRVSLELSGKGEQKKLYQLDAELNELGNRVEQEEQAFHRISKTIKGELELFDSNRFNEFKRTAIEHLEVMLHTQSKMLDYWETYLSNTKSIE